MDTTRQILADGRPPKGASDITIFLGIFGDRWVKSATRCIDAQTGGAVQVIAAVNGHAPAAESKLQDWARETRHHVTVVRNNSNLGPLGSLHRNWDLFESPWVATFHQDDVYGPGHLEEHRQLIRDSPSDVIACFTRMEGVSESGEEIVAGPPLRRMDLDLLPQTELFTTMITRHPVASPTLCFKLADAFVPDLVWFDSGAPDSEWYARLACRGRFRVSGRVTAYYRDTDTSESRLTDRYPRAWQWAQSLERIFHSDDFLSLAKQIPEHERERFTANVLAAVGARYPASPLFEFIQFSAAQALTTAWGYEENSPLEFIRMTLQALGDSAAQKTLDSHLVDSGSVTSASGRQLLGDLPEKSALHRRARVLYKRYAHRLPPRVRQGAVSVYDRLTPRRGAE
jgi:hypothetical protein